MSNWLCFALAALAVAIAPSPPARGDGGEQMTPVLAAVLAPPQAVLQSDRRWKVVYELELVNVTDAPMTLESLEIRAPQADAGAPPVAALTQQAIAADLRVPGRQNEAVLGPGQAGLLFVALSFASRDAVPAALLHRLTATTPATSKAGPPPRSVEDVAPVSVGVADPLVLGPPLRGGGWVAAASCCDSYHRRAALPINGRRYLAQRFAIDWIRIDAQRRLATGDPAQLASYPQYGAEALAVADARVAHVVDGIAEAAPGEFPEGITIGTADGNSVVLDLGAGRFALYAHFQPGSIRVRPGDAVRRGQVLGLVGNSGNSDAPHLHFHVMDGPSPLASNGLPYVIDAFELEGQTQSTDDLDGALKTPLQPIEVSAPAPPARRTRELPADLAIVRFTD